MQFLKRERNLTKPTIDHSFIMKHLNYHNILTDCQHGFSGKEIHRDAANSYLTRHGKDYPELNYPCGRFGLCQSFRQGPS